MRVLMLRNSRAGGSRAESRAERGLARLRLDGASVDVPAPANAADMAEQALEAAGNYDVVLASGGDGTLHAVVNGLMRCDASRRPALALFPVGRGNDFAAHLGLARPEDTLRAMAGGSLRVIDVGRSEDRYFAGIAGTGFDARVARRARETPVLKGSLLYTYATFRTLVGFHAIQAELRYEGGSFEGAITFAAVGNSSRYGGGMRIAPRADLSDGLLDLCLVKAVSRMTLTRVFPSVFEGRHLSHGSVDYHQTRFVEVSTQEPCEIFADGEPMGWTPARFEIVPAALRVYTND